MWLLSTARAELHHFPSPELVPGGYAILSHTWGEHGEQSFKTTQDLTALCKALGSNPRDLATPKVRESCILAEHYGYDWIWNDTCCIDKESSTKLSEAINSMFRWYALAEVCFAYLEGVESHSTGHTRNYQPVLRASDQMFKIARWHSRGWTLQELITPSLVIFVSHDWKTIGNKRELVSLLEEITGVPSQVLTGEMHYSLFSIAERMSWTFTRSTKCVEDQAYCLMGLFNVNMPPIYGKGRQAFQHLQYEIVKQSFDTSLFAWGGFTGSDRVTPLELQETYKFLNTSSQNHSYLLADSPNRFSKLWRHIMYYTPATTNPLQPYLDWQRTSESKPNKTRCFTPCGRIELPRFSVTSYGLKCRLPVIQSDGLVVAVLLCYSGSEHIGLLLHPSNDPVQDPSRNKYNVGRVFQKAEHYYGFARLISLGNNLYELRLNNKVVTPEWHNIFIADSPPPINKDVALSLCSRLHSIPAPSFRLPPRLISQLAQNGMELQSLDVHRSPVGRVPLQVWVTFEDIEATERISLILGTCRRSPSRKLLHWAKAVLQNAANWHQSVDGEHNCPKDHINHSSWRGRKKDFVDAERTVRLSFTHCKVTTKHGSAGTLVANVELKGDAYNPSKPRTGSMWSSRCKEPTSSLDLSQSLSQSLHGRPQAPLDPEPVVESGRSYLIPKSPPGPHCQRPRRATSPVLTTTEAPSPTDTTSRQSRCMPELCDICN